MTDINAPPVDQKLEPAVQNDSSIFTFEVYTPADNRDYANKISIEYMDSDDFSKAGYALFDMTKLNKVAAMSRHGVDHLGTLYSIEFKETKLRFVADLLSLSSLFVLIILGILRKRTLWQN